MKARVERIRNEGRNLGRGILKVDGCVNHQLHPRAPGQRSVFIFDCRR